MARVNGTLTGTAFAAGPPVTLKPPGQFTVFIAPSVVNPPFIISIAAVYTPSLVGTITPPFISSATVVHAPGLRGTITPSFIASVTAVYTPTLTAGGTGVHPDFIPSVTVVYTPVVTSTEVDPDFIDSVTLVYTPTLERTFTGDGVSQVTLEVTQTTSDADARVSQITLEVLVPRPIGLHIWRRS